MLLRTAMHRPAFFLFLVLIMLSSAAQAKTNVNKQVFGKTSDGTTVDLYTLDDGKMEVSITNYGGIVVAMRVPDREGKLQDVVLGHDKLAGYIPNNPHFGGIIGRYANRI